MDTKEYMGDRTLTDVDLIHKLFKICCDQQSELRSVIIDNDENNADRLATRFNFLRAESELSDISMDLCARISSQPFPENNGDNCGDMVQNHKRNP